MTKEEIQKNSEHWYNKYKDAENRITDLENKIADLKANCDLALESDFRICEKNADTYYDQLTKAKKLLERLLITSCNSDVLNLLPNCSEVLRVRVEAEQFLSEVEK